MIIKSWPLLGLAGIIFVLLTPVLVWCVSSLVRANRSDLVVSAGFAREQEIEIPTAGELVILVETPRLSSDFGDFQIELTDKETGQRTLAKYSYTGSQGAIHGLDTAKTPYGRMSIRAPGAYTVRMNGLNPAKNYAGYRVLLSRPYLGRMAFQIVGIVFSAAGMLLSVIWAAWLAGLMKQGP